MPYGIPNISQYTSLLQSNSESGCSQAKASIIRSKKSKISKIFSEIVSNRISGGINLVLRNLLRDVANILGGSFANLIEQELTRAGSPMAYFGAAVTAYITALATIPNVIMVIPYLLTHNLKKYLDVRIKAVTEIKSLIYQVESILRAIPIDAAPTDKTLRDFAKALAHLVRCLQLLKAYKSRLYDSISTRSGYISPSLFRNAVKELEFAIDDIHSQSTASLFSNIDGLTSDEQQSLKDLTSDDIGSAFNQVSQTMLEDYLKRYGPIYVALLKLIKKLEVEPGGFINTILHDGTLNNLTFSTLSNNSNENPKTLSGDSKLKTDSKTLDLTQKLKTSTKEDTEELIDGWSFLSTATEKFVRDNPTLSVTISSPIIDTYVKSLSKILDTLKLLKGAQSTLSAFLPAMNLPINGAIRLISGVKSNLDIDIRKGSNRNLLGTSSLEFKKLGYISQLETAHVLLAGLDSDYRYGNSGVEVISDTVNDLNALAAIESYINNEFPIGDDHPVTQLSGLIEKLIGLLALSLLDPSNRKRVTTTIKDIKVTCNKAVREDQDLLNLLTRFNVERHDWFQNALTMYESLAKNIKESQRSAFMYNPVQFNLAQQIGYGLLDSLILGIVLMNSTANTLNLAGRNTLLGFRAIGSIFTEGAEQQTTQCLKTLDNRLLSEIQKTPTPEVLIKSNETDITKQLQWLDNINVQPTINYYNWEIRDIV